MPLLPWLVLRLMGGRSHSCSFCGRYYLDPQTCFAHEFKCVVQQHERIIPTAKMERELLANNPSPEKKE